MPTVLVISGFRFYFYSNENDEPMHVHVEKGGALGKIWLEPVVQAVYFYGFTTNEQRQIMYIVKTNLATFIEKWNEHFN